MGLGGFRLVLLLPKPSGLGDGHIPTSWLLLQPSNCNLQGSSFILYEAGGLGVLELWWILQLGFWSHRRRCVWGVGFKEDVGAQGTSRKPLGLFQGDPLKGETGSLGGFESTWRLMGLSN